MYCHSPWWEDEDHPIHTEGLWHLWRPLGRAPFILRDLTVSGWATPRHRVAVSRSKSLSQEHGQRTQRVRERRRCGAYSPPGPQVWMGRDKNGSPHDCLLGRRPPLCEREGPARRRCILPACGREVLDERQHAIDYHLPPHFYCWTPAAVTGALSSLAKVVLSHGGIERLIEILKRPHFIPGGYTITPAVEDFLQEFSSHWGEELAQAPS